MRCAFSFLVLAAGTLLSLQAEAGDWFHRGRCEDRMARAGYANEWSRWASPTYDDGYLGYYVGGGAKRRSRGGEPRYCHEGTFGIDYSPIVPGFRESVALNWWHGKRYQGGPGQYESDLKNKPFYNLRRTFRGSEEEEEVLEEPEEFEEHGEGAGHGEGGGHGGGEGHGAMGHGPAAGH